MLLTITTTYRPARDLGFLLHKNPDRLHQLDLPYGKAHIFFSEAQEEQATAALLLETDPLLLFSKRKRLSGFTIRDYVNDRPYVASSLMSVAINRAFSTLLSNQCKHNPALLETPMPLKISVTPVACEEGADMIRNLFAPLGYQLKIERAKRDAAFPEWGESPYFSLTLQRTCLLRRFLEHLYVLLPVMDNKKHYFIDKSEIDKLVRFGGEWLQEHPYKDGIIERYLRFYDYVEETFQRLGSIKKAGDTAQEQDSNDKDDLPIEKSITLGEQRRTSIIAILKQHHASRILDMGCAEGKLLCALHTDPYFVALTGADVSLSALALCEKKLRRVDTHFCEEKSKTRLIQASLCYLDARLKGFDAIVLSEVIEHLDPGRLDFLQHLLFSYVEARMIVITTPNCDYNTLFPKTDSRMPGDRQSNDFRHTDHRFEWNRTEFKLWGEAAARQHAYSFAWLPIGAVDAQCGPPTQMGVFLKKSS